MVENSPVSPSEREPLLSVSLVTLQRHSKCVQVCLRLCSSFLNCVVLYSVLFFSFQDLKNYAIQYT